MKLGLVGAGNIGGTLGKKWAVKNHEVFFGVRNPQKETLVSEMQSVDGNIKLGLAADAIAASEVIVFAVPGASVEQLVSENAESLAGKIVIDASNNMRGDSRNSLSYIAQKVPTARLFRAFSSLGWENFENPEFAGVKADLFYCGDEDARATVEALIFDIGLEPVYLGGTDQAGLVEGMTDMWFTLALRQKMGRRIAFKLLK